MIKEKLKKLLTDTVYPACLYFTIILFIMSGFASIVEGAEHLLLIDSMLLFFLFSIACAILNKIFRSKLSDVFKVFLHCVGLFAAFFLLFIIPKWAHLTAKSVFILIVIYFVIYFICLGISRLFRSAKKTKENNETEYKQMFK